MLQRCLAVSVMRRSRISLPFNLTSKRVAIQPRLHLRRLSTIPEGPSQSIRLLLCDSDTFLMDSSVNKARAALRNQIFIFRSKGEVKLRDELEAALTHLVTQHQDSAQKVDIGHKDAAVSAAVTVNGTDGSSEWHDRAALLFLGFLTAQETISVVNHFIRKNPDSACLKFISLTLNKFVGLSCRGGETEREKALAVIACLPLSPCPAYAVPVATNDIIWPKFTLWKQEAERSSEGSVDASLVASLLSPFSATSQLTPDLIQTLMKEIVIKRWLKSLPDPEVALHHANVLLASMIASIDPSPSNRVIAEITESWTNAMLTALKLPENRRAQKVMGARDYLGWLTLLIAEIAKRRAVHHHDIFLIKELMDKTLAGWDAESVVICGTIISSKFSYTQLWKQKIGKWFT
eukprot:TRINITY_DN3617_c0_g1_i1.p1 TRINITY_DN3617_c0_g1~~TRINITY_DN3617_c0_g1_i1.p1  ORF type:complete len:405 (-),score=39.80 TRINITY_DN3617_c0_g1_i1:382-1596(-)